jgi:TonB-dependent starch-binding outer membrane protein SusC
MKKDMLFIKRLLFFVAFIALNGSIFAQTKIITGVVKDVKGEAIIGVAITIRGAGIGTVTKFDGTFNLAVPLDAKILEFSYIGMQKQSVTTDKNFIEVIMIDNAKVLDDLVIVGYGTMKRSNFTGAVATLNSGKIAEKGATSILSAIQGSAPGVQVQQSSSRAGATFDIIIRGQNSISGSTAPLYVVDGVITSSIDFLNPQEIERIDILKDASSSSIYGSRGSHGVVSIMTKSGKSIQNDAKTSISYDGYYGVSRVANMPHFLDTQEWMKYRGLNYQYTTDINNDGVLEFSTTDMQNVWMGGLKLNNLNDGKGIQPVYPNATWGGSQWLLDRYRNNSSTDWVGLVTQQGTQQNHFIDVSGNTKNVSYGVGVGYQDEKGVFVNDSYNRYNLKGSLTANLNSKWTTGLNINTSYSTQESGSDNAILNAFRMSPIVTAYTNGNLDATLNHLEGDIIVVPGKTTEAVSDINGNPIFLNSIGGSGLTSSVNPLIDLANTSNNTRRITALGSFYLQFTPIEHLVFKTTFSPTISTYRKGIYKSTLTEGNYDNPLTTNVENDAKASVDNFTNFDYTWDNQLNYNFVLNKDHDFQLLALQSFFMDKSELYTVSTAGYNSNDFWYNLGTATNTVNTKVASAYTESKMVSYATRIKYSYKSKYLATLTVRTDGSSKLGNGYKWKMFPSAAVAWRVSDEPFMKHILNSVSNLKIRASYGITGNNNISPYLTQLLANQTTYYNFGSTNAIGIAPGALANQTLTWESTNEFNVGLNLGLWNNRLDLAVDLYQRLSSDLLQNRTLPSESGAGTMTDNLGAVLNRGIEVALSLNLINSKSLQWTVNGSFSKNQNRITNLFGNTTPGYIFINNSTQKWMVGESINSIYGYVYDGVWTADGILSAIASKDPRVLNSAGKVIAREGQAKVKDFDNNGIDANDRRIQGHSDPTWTAGLSTNLSYKGFDFAMNIYTAQGMTVFSPFIEEFTNYNDRGRQKIMMDYYIPAGTTLIGDDGYFYTQQTVHDYQGRPMAYTDNGTKSNCGAYWHTARETANDMPGAWVDASYIKVRNVVFGYTLPKSVVKCLNVTSFRMYCNVLNPFVSTKYEGFDPEWAGASMGKDNGPATVTYQFGVNVKF